MHSIENLSTLDFWVDLYRMEEGPHSQLVYKWGTGQHHSDTWLHGRGLVSFDDNVNEEVPVLHSYDKSMKKLVQHASYDDSELYPLCVIDKEKVGSPIN